MVSKSEEGVMSMNTCHINKLLIEARIEEQRNYVEFPKDSTWDRIAQLQRELI